MVNYSGFFEVNTEEKTLSIDVVPMKVATVQSGGKSQSLSGIAALAHAR